WAPWHSTEDRDEIPQDMRTVLKSAKRLLHPKTLMEILQSFALFSTVKTRAGKPGVKIKILPRYPQYEAAKAIVKRVKTGDARKGLIWHFQGSGKSLLMVFAAQKLRLQPALRNPTVIIVVDRRDLDAPTIQAQALDTDQDGFYCYPVRNYQDILPRVRAADALQHVDHAVL
ncbi:MAG: hypothetical protein DSZ23_00900, partial [Thermodesulfatator sp.]